MYGFKDFIKIQGVSFSSQPALAIGKPDFHYWKQPVLTANGTLGGESFAVQASSESSSSYQAWKCFDMDTSSYWRTSGANPYLIAYNPDKINVTAFNLVNYSSSTYKANSVQVYGSNDNVTYTAIGSPITLNTGTADYTLDNTSYYKYYKFEFTPYSTSQMRLHELTLTADKE